MPPGPKHDPSDQSRFHEVSPARPEHEGRALLFVKGYLQEGCDYTAWTDAFRRLGWNGSVVALEWYTGGRLIPHVIGGVVGSFVASTGFGWLVGSWLPRLVFKTAAAPGVVWSGAAKVATMGISLGSGSRAHWCYYNRRADAEGARLGALLSHERPAWARRELRLVGYSLGARLVHAALQTAAAQGTCIAAGVDLYAGALAADSDWVDAARAVDGPIRNFYSKHDSVLRGLFQVSELATPIGLTPIGRAGAVVDVDASEVIGGHDHYPGRLERALFAIPRCASPDRS